MFKRHIDFRNKLIFCCLLGSLTLTTTPSYAQSLSELETTGDAPDLVTTIQAADEGYAPAQYNLGLMYDVGQGVVRDYQQSVFWYTKAAENGFVEAQFNLGGMYFAGQGTLRDYKKAFYWYTKAAEQGHLKAQFVLGLANSAGQEMPQDYRQAFYWFSKRPLSRVLPMPNINLGGCIIMAKGCHRTTNKLCIGTPRRPNKGTPNPNLFSD